MAKASVTCKERVGFEKNCPSRAHETGGNEMSEAGGEETGEPEGGPGGRKRTMTHSWPTYRPGTQRK